MVAKLGVCSLRSLDRNRSLLGRPKRFALSLYARILRAHPELDAWLPRILERHQAYHGAFKRTADRRFLELDELVARRFSELRAARSGVLCVHDVGVSDARSSVELMERLRPFGPLDFLASDRNRRVLLVRSEAGRWTVAYDEEGHAVQYEGLGFVLSPVSPESPWIYPVNRVVLAWFEHRVRPTSDAVVRQLAGKWPADFEECTVGRHRVTSFPLVCRAALERIERGELRVERHDVCAPMERRFHLVRVLNVLNHVPPGNRPAAARRLYGGVHEGGLLVVGRTADPGGETRATVWRREEGELCVLDRTHGGAELEEIFEGYADPSETGQG